MVPFTLLPLLPAGKTGAKRLNKSASSSCCTEYPYLFAKNLKKHLKSNEVKIHQIHGILIASWFPHGLRQQHTKPPVFPLPDRNCTRNSCNELDFRAYMDFPSVFAISVPHGGGFILRRFSFFILRRISHGPPPHQIRGFARKRGRRSPSGQSVEISIPPGGLPELLCKDLDP